MKKIICTAVSALALATLADGVNSTEFGVLYVPSSSKQTIVSVPWLESGTGTENVSVSNLVLTAGLKNGDTLTLYSDTEKAYTASWRFNGTKWVKSEEGDDTLPRGKALMLERDDPGAGFYIMGKPATFSASESTMTLAAGEGFSKPAVFSLIAPPSVSAVAPNSLTWSGLTPGSDKLIIGTDTTMTILTWKGDTKKWGTDGNTALPLGTGMWFKSQGTGTKTVTWPAQ